MTLVVDASALVDALLDRVAANRLARLARDRPLVSPVTLDAEVLSSLRGLVRGGALSAARAEIALEDLESASITREPLAPLIGAAWALRENFSAYDALYVALAAYHDAPLVTSDARLTRAPSPGVSIVLLG